MKKLSFLFAAFVAILFSVTTYANAGMVVTSTAVNAKGFLADKYGYNDKTQLDAKEMPITSFPFEIKNAPKGTQYAKTAIWGGIIIALGRALGETMAIAYIIGNMNLPLTSIFDSYVTVTSVLVNEFNEAGGMQLSSLYYMALLLFILNFLTLIAAKLYVARRS